MKIYTIIGTNDAVSAIKTNQVQQIVDICLEHIESSKQNKITMEEFEKLATADKLKTNQSPKSIMNYYQKQLIDAGFMTLEKTSEKKEKQVTMEQVLKFIETCTEEQRVEIRKSLKK